MSTVKAVLISDVHYSLKTLALADASLRAAFTEARRREVPLIIAGDLSDTKALLRAECVNAILKTFSEFPDVENYTIVGNHDLINEKSEAHSLNFLEGRTWLVREMNYDSSLDLYFIGYQHDTAKLESILEGIPDGATIVMHQGIMGAHMGEYVVDKSSISPEKLARFRVITGHYHRHHSIGTATYIGTPYTVTFTEASDGPKGIQLLHADGSLEQVPLNLRRHVIRECRYEDVMQPIDVRSDDLLWVKVSGPASEVDKLKKKVVGQALIGHENFRFDRIYDEAAPAEIEDVTLPPDQLFDDLIEQSEETPEQKAYLSKLWRQVMG